MPSGPDPQHPAERGQPSSQRPPPLDQRAEPPSPRPPTHQQNGEPPTQRPPAPGPRGPQRGQRPPGQRPPSPAQRRQPRLPPPKRRHHHGRTSRARIGLVVIFVLFRLLDFILLLNVPTEYSRPLISSIITGAIWTTALLIAIALRKPWARLILLGILGLNTLGNLIWLPMIVDVPGMFTPLITSLLISAGSFAWLSYSRDVHRLTSREHH